MLESLWAYVLVFLLAAVPFLEAIAIIPVAIVAGMPTVPVFLLALLGNLITMLLVIVFVDKIKEWRRKRKGEQADNSKRSQRAQSLWRKYGLPGLSLIGPFFVGSHLTAFMGAVLGGSKKQVAVWMTISLVAWCLAAAILVHMGIGFLNHDVNDNARRWFSA